MKVEKIDGELHYDRCTAISEELHQHQQAAEIKRLREALETIADDDCMCSHVDAHYKCFSCIAKAALKQE